MSVNASNVTSAKPKITGAVYRAPLNTPLPTNATAELNSSFKSVGYISDDGITNGMSVDSSSIKAFGGSVVLTTSGAKEDTFQFNMIETLNTEAQKAVYGDNNVEGDLTQGIKIQVNAESSEESAWIIELILRNGVLKRIVIPQAIISDYGDITYKDDEVSGYDVTLSCAPDNSNNTHYEYIQSKV